MVERLVANEKVEGSTPFARSKSIVIKSKFITKLFQKFLDKKDIRKFKKSLFYYVIFRIVRPFLSKDIIINIFKFKILGSVKKNYTSYFLLKKCEFGDDHEIDTLTRLSKKNKIFFLDCGCNYGFYSFHVASLSNSNYVISIEASKRTSELFLKNKELNINLNNILFYNMAVSENEGKEILFNQGINDWESSVEHSDFQLNRIDNIKTCKIDSLLNSYELRDYLLVFKLDIEGHEMKAIAGALNIIEKFSPIIIIEFSKFIFQKKKNIDYINFFLNKFDYQIYDTKKKVVELKQVLLNIENLKKRYKTIGNYYLIKKSSYQEEQFKKNE